VRLEYFHDACEGRGLLLLYGDNFRDVENLRGAVRDLTVTDAIIQLHDLEFVEPVANCQLTATSASRGHGVRRVSANAFRWTLSPSEWEDTDAMLEPFCNASAAQAGVSFQYLNPHAGPEVIYSTSRAW